MKKFMVVYTADGLNGATFADDYSEARQKMMDIECGLGGYAEIYERQEKEYGSEYVFLEA